MAIHYALFENKMPRAADNEYLAMVTAVGTAIWLLSDSASFTTGSVVKIDGGLEAYNGI